MQARRLRLICEFDRSVFVVVVVSGLADEVQAVQLMDYFKDGHIATAEFFWQTHVVCCAAGEENFFKGGAAGVN